jgi:hypothetical protein
MSEDQAAQMILDRKAYRSLMHNHEWVIVIADYGYGENIRLAEPDESKVLDFVARTLGKIPA